MSETNKKTPTPSGTEQPVVEKKKNKKPLIIGGILGGVAVIAIGAIVLSTTGNGAIVLSTTGNGGGIITPSIKPYTTAVINGKEYNNDKTIAIVNGVEVQSYEKLAELTDANKNPYVCAIQKIVMTGDKKHQEALEAFDYLIDMPVEEMAAEIQKHSTLQAEVYSEREKLLNDKSLAIPDAYKLPVLYWSDTKDVPKEYITKRGFQTLDVAVEGDTPSDEVKIKVQGSVPATYTYVCGMFNNGSVPVWPGANIYGTPADNPIYAIPTSGLIDFGGGRSFSKWVAIRQMPPVNEIKTIQPTYYSVCLLEVRMSILVGGNVLGEERTDEAASNIIRLYDASWGWKDAGWRNATPEVKKEIVMACNEWLQAPAGTPLVLPTEVKNKLKKAGLIDKNNNIITDRTTLINRLINYGLGQSGYIDYYNQMVAPTIVDINTVNGQTVDITVDSFIDITTGDFAPGDYTAVVSDPAIVAFDAGGKIVGEVIMNPGLAGINVGSTKVELTNITTGEKTTFTVVVNI